MMKEKANLEEAKQTSIKEESFSAENKTKTSAQKTAKSKKTDKVESNKSAKSEAEEKQTEVKTEKNQNKAKQTKAEKNQTETKTEAPSKEESFSTENLEEENKDSLGEQGDYQVEFETNSVEKETIKEIGISEEIISEKMKNVYEMKNPKKRKKSTIINIIMLLINIVLMAFILRTLFNNLEDTNITNLVSSQGKKLWWLGGGVIMYLVYIIIQIIMYRVLVKNLSGRKSWKIAYDTAIVGKYYDNITPFAVGGQTMQILRLTEHGIGAGVSTSIPILKMMINSGVNALLALIFFIFGLPIIPKTSILNDFLILLLEIVGVIGLIITVIMALFIFLISSGTIVTRSLISGILRLGYKMKLIKDYRTTYKKVMNQVAEYKFSMGYLWRHKKILFQLILFSVLECLSYGSLVFFVAMAFMDGVEANIFLFIFMCLVKYYLCSMASCYIPLPGGTGLMEVSFILLFGVSIGNNMGWALLAWRFLTYYIIIAHGFIHELKRIIIGLVKSKRNKNLAEIKT